ncbi:MAG: MoaD/ThiS family protein [Desulfoplanes sp.]|nr:MoaD/ThiS family protein [Desulfoplanes sp.]MDD4648654.1 MoaD/ThiS family protein [Desulfoplanes sp.]
MSTVVVNAFSFLQKKLAAKGVGYSNVQVPFRPGMHLGDVVTFLELESGDVEGAFVNGIIRPFDALLNEGDRVALVPPGTPGPYRYLLGIRGGSQDGEEK